MSSLSHSLSVDTQIALSIEIHYVNARSSSLSLHYKNLEHQFVSQVHPIIQSLLYTF